MGNKLLLLKRIKGKINNNKRAFRIALFAVSVLVIALFSLIMFKDYKKKNNYIKTEGIDLQYRIYDANNWTPWVKNGQVAESKNDCIFGIQIKIKSDTLGHIFYNTYSPQQDFNDNSDYDGETSNNLIDPIMGIKIGVSDDLFKKYKLFYRTYNEKDKWLGYSDYFEVISGNKEKCIKKIQLKMFKIDEVFEYEKGNTSIGFDLAGE